MKYIELSRGLKAAVDDEDFEWLNALNWHAAKSRSKFYASRSKAGQLIRMHNVILPPPEGMLVDHINGDSLDNRRSNLRVCTRSENVLNSSAKKSSKFLGVSYAPKERMWNANVRLGRYATEQEAAEAVIKAIALLRPA